MEVGARCDPRRHALPILRARELLTLAHCLQGDARQGLAGYPPIIEQLERDLGLWHSRVAEAHNAYAAAAYQCGLAEEAIASLRRTIAIDEAQHGPDAQPLRLARVGLDGILANEGLYDEGLALMRQASEEFDVREGVQHPLAALALNRWVAALIKAGQLDEAAARLEALRARCEGDERALDDWRHESARWLRARGRADDALELLQSMHQRRLAAPAGLGVAAWWELIGGVLVDAGRPAEAMAPLDTALAIYGSRQPYGSVAIARTRLELGRARLGLGETSTAVREFRASLAYWEARGPDRPPAVETAGWLALALHRAGEDDEAGRLAALASSGPWPADVERAAGLRRSLADAGLVPRSAA